MKPIDVKGNTYINICKEIYDNDPKFKVGDNVKISKYKKGFAKSYTPNWTEEIFAIKGIKIRFRGLMLWMILMVQKILEHCMKKNCKR